MGMLALYPGSFLCRLDTRLTRGNELCGLGLCCYGDAIDCIDEKH